jgi:hypothetical protein
MNKLVSLGASALLAVPAAAQAAETEYSFTWCGHTKRSVLVSNPDFSVFLAETWGIVTPSSTFKPYENAAVHCMGYNRVVQGKLTMHSSCQFTDSTGDSFFGESAEVPDKPPSWTFLYGTGKWQGISGAGTFRRVALGKLAADGSIDICFTPTGRYTLPE